MPAPEPATPAEQRPHATIEGPRLRLRAVEERDLPAILAWLREHEVLYWWDNELPDLEAARAEFLDPDPGQPRWCFVIEEGGRGIGVIQYAYPYWDPDYYWKANIDIFIGEPDARERSVGTEAVRTLLGHLFEAKGLHLVTIDPEVGNARAIRAYEKAGFRLDGVLRHHDRLRGEYVDTHLMSILADEWPEAKARWLEAGRALA